jgi:DNA-binding MarR family transcriptional regulator
MQTYMRHAVEDMTAVLQENDLSMPQLGTLQFLRAEGAQSITSVANRLNLSLTATSHLINRLVQKGLLHREEDAEDRRQKRVTLAAAGHELVAQIHQRSAASLETLLKRIPGERREALERAVEAVVAELEGNS